MPGKRDQTKREIARQLEVKEAFGGKRAPQPCTDGLVPMRRKRLRDDGKMEEHGASDEWAREQPWYPRVVFKRFDARWWIWWCKPEVKDG